MNTVMKLAKSSLKTNKSKSFLAIITIILTTCLLTSVGIIAVNWNEVNLNTAKSMFGNHHIVIKKSTSDENKKLSLDLDVDSIKVVKSIGNKEIKELGTKFILQYIGYNKDLSEDIKIKEGKLPEKENEISISDGYMSALGKVEPKIGDTISIDYESRKDSVNKTKDFIVSGIIESSKSDIEGKSFFGIVSQEYLLKEEYEKETTFTTYINFNNKKDMDVYAANLKAEELAKDFNIDGSRVDVNEDYIKSLNPDATIIMGAIALALTVIISSMLVIYSIFYIAVINKVQEYGKLRAIGATKKQIKKLILTEGMSLAIIGIPIGLFLGYSIGQFITVKVISNTGVVAGEYNIIIVILAAIASIFTVWISLLKPMKIASKISPVEAMKYDGNSNNKAKTRSGYLEMNVSRLIKANLNRNKKRTVITLISLILSGILFIVSSTVLRSMNVKNMTDEAYGGLDMVVNLDNYKVDSPENPEKELYNVLIDNPITNIIESIESIDGVKEVQVSRGNLIKNIESNEWSSIGIAEFRDTTRETVLAGELDIEKMEKENGIILNYPDLQEYGLNLGEKVTFEVIVNGVKEVKEFKIAAITEGHDFSMFILPEKLYNESFDYDTNESLGIKVESNKYEDVKSQLVSMLSNEPYLKGSYYDESYKLNEKSIMSSKLMVYALVIVIGVIGFINLINTMITSVLVRRKELGMLQAIGLSNKQFTQMIRKEGLFYIISSISIILTLGNILGYLAFFMMKNSGASYASYAYPVTETILLIVLPLIAQVMVSYGISKNFNKDSLVDRVRYSE